jgi:hypothetical protein
MLVFLPIILSGASVSSVMSIDHENVDFLDSCPSHGRIILYMCVCVCVYVYICIQCYCSKKKNRFRNA